MQKPTLAVVLFISSLVAFAIIPTVYAIMVVSQAKDGSNIAKINDNTLAFQDYNSAQ